MTDKIPLGMTVFDATTERITWTLDTFSRVCLSLSGGKDSTVMLHRTADIARLMGRKFCVLFIDWEVQFQMTIDHVRALKAEYADVIEQFIWVALPLTTVNGVSQFQPEWVCWEKGRSWVRESPADAITDPDYFSFYASAMTFEDFTLGFSDWFAGKSPAAMMIGIRTDESLNRYRAITNRQKICYADDKPWTTASASGNTWNIYPIYDWKVSDIWTYFARNPNKRCNPLYNLMYQAGVPMRFMRVCEPFGPEQRQGLWLYHILEPERWALLCQRVSGANTGGTYARNNSAFYARRHLTKPGHLSWKAYAFALLDSMPEPTAEHYKNKIAVYLRWYQQRQYPVDIPDEQEKDTGAKDIPSWRRICKVLLGNDYWCRGLSFSPTKPRHYARYLERMKNRRKTWNILVP
ncbi:phosphoadenosine phosphosulfate reductase [Dryocola sp. BD586]|uniref:phosphoadenosine phosphosulfate reductase n=1 Tax=Dryocola sp. BD586 TaxID=3133271 RepID=UPI003F4F9FDF